MALPPVAFERAACEASGDGKLDLSQAGEWLEVLEQHGIADVNRPLKDKAETTSTQLPGARIRG